MAMYSKVSFWDDRYRANTNPYEWYQGYSSLRHLLNPIYFASLSSRMHPSYNPPPNSRPPEGGVTAVTMMGGMDREGGAIEMGGGSSTAGAYPAVNGAPPGGCPSTRPLFPPREAARTLILGCGNATFGEDMQRDGWTGRIVNVDFSPVVIDQMRLKYGPAFYHSSNSGGGGLSGCAPPMMEWLLADITQPLPFEAGTFDLIVSKGSFDAVLCGAGSRFNILRVVRECVRLLAPETGIFFLVTHGNPDNRVEYLEYQNDLYHYWSSVQVHTVARPIPGMPGHNHPHSYGLPHQTHAFPPPRTDFVYICRKRATHNSPERIVAENTQSWKTAAALVAASDVTPSSPSLKMPPQDDKPSHHQLQKRRIAY